MVSVIKRIFAPLDADFWAGVIMSTSLSPIPYPSDLHREHEQLPVARQPQFGASSQGTSIKPLQTSSPRSSPQYSRSNQTVQMSRRASLRPPAIQSTIPTATRTPMSLAGTRPSTRMAMGP